MTQTRSPRLASAAPTFAVVVVFPTPPFPDVTTMAFAFTRGPPKQPGHAFWRARCGDYNTRSMSVRSGTSGGLQVRVAGAQAPGARLVEHHRQFELRAFAGYAHDSAQAEPGMADAFTA